MAERTTIARPYADAAFSIARDQDKLAQWSDMLALANGIAGDARVHDSLESPKLDAPEKATLFMGIAGDVFSAEMRNFIRVLIDARRIGLLPEIGALFESLRNEAEGVAQATIQSAQPLSDHEVSELTAAMSRRLGKRVEAKVDVVPSLLGGARIAVGDTVIDGSVRGKLDQMRQSLLNQ
ncbi:MAG TPA: F0F1 ATP synthase subunit delta [Casimicrobiaceae bacterium]|nr:F0F1 ATP synthase subunit delta [Casimicrobiaceae bacterium]